MGCDIHGGIEWRSNPDASWFTHCILKGMGRDYELFGKLAGVRGGGCLVEPRGFPDDASPYIKDEWRECGDHTPSWLSPQEFDEAFFACAVPAGNTADYRAVMKTLHALADEVGGSNVRFVFWFDS